jgi:hypothetical protein
VTLTAGALSHEKEKEGALQLKDQHVGKTKTNNK